MIWIVLSFFYKFFSTFFFLSLQSLLSECVPHDVQVNHAILSKFQCSPEQWSAQQYAIAHYSAGWEIKKCQIWRKLKGRAEESQSLDILALIKGQITVLLVCKTFLPILYPELKSHLPLKPLVDSVSIVDEPNIWQNSHCAAAVASIACPMNLGARREPANRLPSII